MSVRYPDPRPGPSGPAPPFRVECEILNLEWEGEIPEVLHGAFFRCGPDRQFPPMPGDPWPTANADGMLRELREKFPDATIIGVTGIWGSDQPPATMTTVDGIVGDAVRDVNGTWLDIGFPLVGHQNLLQPDGIHPNAAGQKVVAQTIESKLRPLNLAL